MTGDASRRTRRAPVRTHGEDRGYRPRSVSRETRVVMTGRNILPRKRRAPREQRAVATARDSLRHHCLGTDGRRHSGIGRCHIGDEYPYKPTQIRKMISEGKFPSPLQIGPRGIAWYEDEVIEWQHNLPRVVRRGSTIGRKAVTA
jgi:CP4-57 regulatory protein AlpA